MSSSSIARQNRRMRHKQLPPKMPSELSPASLDILKDETNHHPLPSTTGCSFVNCDVSSQPIGKVFLEEERGFKAIDSNHMQFLNNESSQPLKKQSSSIMAYKASKVFHHFSYFCHGLLGGMSFIHLLLLLSSTDDGTLTFLSQPIHNIYNFMCIICCISAFDRYDIGNFQDLCDYVKKCQLHISIILIYPISLLMSLSTVNVDEKLWLPNTNSTEWQTSKAQELFYWKILGILKCSGALLAWILLCWNPSQNLFLLHLKAINKRNSTSV